MLLELCIVLEGIAENESVSMPMNGMKIVKTDTNVSVSAMQSVLSRFEHSFNGPKTEYYIIWW